MILLAKMSHLDNTVAKTDHYRGDQNITLSQLRKQIKARNNIEQITVPKAMIDSIRQSMRVEDYDISEEDTYIAIQNVLDLPPPTVTTVLSQS